MGWGIKRVDLGRNIKTLGGSRIEINDDNEAQREEFELGEVVNGSQLDGEKIDSVGNQLQKNENRLYSPNDARKQVL